VAIRQLRDEQGKKGEGMRGKKKGKRGREDMDREEG